MGFNGVRPHFMPCMPAERIRVQPAPPPLRARVLCAIEREVQASAALPLRAQVHANPFACLNVVVQGCVESLHGALPANFVAGPFSAPFDTRVGEPLRSVSLVFQPWLLEPVFGLAASGMVDSVVDVAAAHGPAAASLATSAALAARGEKPWPEAWREVERRVAGCSEPDLALDVLAGQGVEPAAAAVGCSERQYRRRFLRHMGLGPAAWLRLTRWHSALLGLAPHERPAPPLAELAAEAGYADQSHLTRETGAIASRSPAQLRRALERGEGHWSLQPARVRNLQDAFG